MNIANPTAIHLGMAGQFFGKSYRVAGRVVLGMQERGETYYWHEFNLVSPDGDSATLVYEFTEFGAVWRLFVEFTPDNPMPAPDAASKRVGDPLNLDGTDARVTLVSESRIYHIEGQAPEGEDLGDVANYFNAQGGGTMFVVSWTGAEVEFYRGANLSNGDVKAAFNLKPEMLSNFGELLGSPDPGISSATWLRFVAVSALLAVLLVGFLFFTVKSRPAPVRRVTAPAPVLKIGSAGRLNRRVYQVQARDLVEIAQTGLRSQEQEYHLSEVDGSQALLVQGWLPGSADWVLFTPLRPLSPITPYRAAAVRMGETVEVDGFVGPVTRLFQSTIRQTETAEATGAKTGSVLYGYAAQRGSALLLVNWNEAGLNFFAGKVFPPKEIAAAFASNTAQSPAQR
jgi:hypothetical protein